MPPQLNDPNAFPLGKYALAPPNTPQWLRTFPTEPTTILGWRVDEDGKDLVQRIADLLDNDYEALDVPAPGIDYIEIAPPSTDVTYEYWYKKSRRKDAKRHKKEVPLWREPIDYEADMVRLVGGFGLQHQVGYETSSGVVTRTRKGKRRYLRRRTRRRPRYETIRPGDPRYLKQLYSWDTTLQNNVQIRHNGSAVWWTDPDHGPVQAVTLRDLVMKTQPMTTRGGRQLWMMSIDQWDNQEFPPESQGGPPFVEHVSVARENPVEWGWQGKDAGEMHRTKIIAPRYTPKWLLANSFDAVDPQEVWSDRSLLGGAHTWPWLEVEFPSPDNIEPWSAFITPPSDLESDVKREDVPDEAANFLAALKYPGDSKRELLGAFPRIKRWKKSTMVRRYGKGTKKRLVRGHIPANRGVKQAFDLLTPLHNGSPIWWFDHGEPIRPALVLDFHFYKQGSDLGKRSGKHYYAMSYADWESGNWPDEIQKLAPKGAWENPAATRTITDEQIAFMYGEGMSIRDIASAYGMSKGTVERALKNTGTPLRTKKEASLLPAALMKAGRTDPGTEKQIVDLYLSGQSVDAVAQSIGVGWSTVKNVLTRHGIDLRPLVSAKPPPDVEQRAIEMYRDGKSLLMIGRELGISHTGVRNILLRHGIERRPRGDISRFAGENPAGEDYGDENFPTAWVEAPSNVPTWMRKYRDRRTGKIKDKLPKISRIAAGHFDALLEVTYPPFDSELWKGSDVDSPAKMSAKFGENLIAGLSGKKTLAIGDAWEIYGNVRNIASSAGRSSSWNALRDALALMIPIFNGSPIWWVDLDDGPQREASLLDLVVMHHPNLSQKPDRSLSQIWLMSLDQWDNGEWPLEKDGGPPARGTSAGFREARENPASDGGLICMGREFSAVLKDGREIKANVRDGMLHDPKGTYWPKCSLLVAPFENGTEVSDQAGNYFGRNAEVLEGHVELPPQLLDEWNELGEVKEVFYDRAGTKHPGFFRHEFHKPKGVYKLVFLIKGKVAKQPAVLYQHGDCFRLELPSGCMVDDRGIVLP